MAFLQDSIRSIGNSISSLAGPSFNTSPIKDLAVYEPGSKEYVADLKRRNGGLIPGRDDQLINSYKQQIESGGLTPEEADILIKRNPSAAGLLKASQYTFGLRKGVENIRDAKGNFDPMAAREYLLREGQFGAAQDVSQFLPADQQPGYNNRVMSTHIGNDGKLYNVMSDNTVVQAQTPTDFSKFANKTMLTDAGVLRVGQTGSPETLVPTEALAAGAGQIKGAETAAQKEAERAAALTAAKPTTILAMEFGLQKNQLVGDLISEARNNANAFTTGILGAGAKKVPGTPAFNLSQTVDGIVANIGFDTLDAMRKASPTGGALGQVSEREIALLQRVISSLEQSQTKEQFLKNLDRVEAQRKKSWDAIADAYKRDYGEDLPQNLQAYRKGSVKSNDGWSIQEIK